MGIEKSATSRLRGGFRHFHPEVTGRTAVPEPNLRAPRCMLLRTGDGGVIPAFFLVALVVMEDCSS
eukprot:11191928-Karenia_brevis.AAC.1